MIIKTTTNIIREAKSFTASIQTVGNVPTTQTYDEASGEYVPDRSLGLGVLLICATSVAGQDTTDTPEERGWWIVSDTGAETQITSDTAGFTLWPNGYATGLMVERNVHPATPLKLLYKGKTGGMRFMREVTLYSDYTPDAAPELELDFPAVSVWNPYLTDRDKVTVTPRIRDKGKTGLTVKWVRPDGSGVRDIDPTDPMDAELTLNTATNALTIDRRWMGECPTYICQLWQGTTLIRERPVTIRRRIPDYDLRPVMAGSFTEADTEVWAQAWMGIIGGDRIADPSKELRLGWWDGNTRVGEGNSVAVAVAGRDSVEIGLEPEDRGPMKLLTYGGAYLTYNGKLLGGRP